MNDLQSNSAEESSSKSTAIRWRWAAGFAAIVALGSVAVAMQSCAGDDGTDLRGYGNGGGGESSSSSSSGATDAGVEPAKPCVTGTKVECHITVGTNGNVLTCLSGEKTCVNGTWGPCVGAFSAHVGWDSPLASAGNSTDIHLLNLSDAGPCQNNPCDPYCLDFEENPALDGGYQVVPTVETVYYTGSLEDALALNPPGFVDKGMKTPCTPGNISDCQFDSHCVPSGTNGKTCPSGAAYCCMAWNSLEFDTTCNKPDVTTGFACTKDGLPTIPVCNRGSVTLPANTRVYVFPGNSPQFPACDPNDKPKSECLVSVPVPPGSCININNCVPQFGGNGTRTIFVNPPKLPMNGGKNNPLWQDECTCKNNWGVWSGDSAICYEKPNYSASPVVKNQIYHAECPPTTRAQWQYLTWNTTTPLDSSVVWRGRAAASIAELGSAGYVALGTARVLPAPDTHICSPAGPSGCPVNVFTALGGSPNAHNEYFELEITINPSTNKTQGAGVNSWQLSYSCPPAQ